MERELATLVEAVQNAGAKVRELVRVGFEVQTKSDRSLVTTVDYEVNRILHEMQSLLQKYRTEVVRQTGLHDKGGRT